MKKQLNSAKIFKFYPVLVTVLAVTFLITGLAFAQAIPWVGPTADPPGDNFGVIFNNPSTLPADAQPNANINVDGEVVANSFTSTGNICFFGDCKSGWGEVGGGDIWQDGGGFIFYNEVGDPSLSSFWVYDGESTATPGQDTASQIELSGVYRPAGGGVNNTKLILKADAETGDATEHADIIWGDNYNSPLNFRWRYFVTGNDTTAMSLRGPSGSGATPALPLRLDFANNTALFLDSASVTEGTDVRSDSAIVLKDKASKIYVDTGSNLRNLIGFTSGNAVEIGDASSLVSAVNIRAGNNLNPGFGTINLAVNGTPNVTVTGSGGYVGIGTGAPTSRLHVVDARASDGNDTNGAEAAGYFLNTVGHGVEAVGGPGSKGVAGRGNVGVGGQGISPDSRGFTAGVWGHVNSSGGFGGYFTTGGQGHGLFATDICLGSETNCINSWANLGDGIWQLNTANNKIYYNAANVGIGTNDPGKKLHIRETAAMGSGIAPGMTIENTATDYYTSYNIQSGGAGGGIGLGGPTRPRNTQGDIFINNNTPGEDIVFITNGSGEVMRITGTGRVAIAAGADSMIVGSGQPKASLQVGTDASGLIVGQTPRVIITNTSTDANNNAIYQQGLYVENFDGNAFALHASNRNASASGAAGYGARLDGNTRALEANGSHSVFQNNPAWAVTQPASSAWRRATVQIINNLTNGQTSQDSADRDTNLQLINANATWTLQNQGVGTFMISEGAQGANPPRLFIPANSNGRIGIGIWPTAPAENLHVGGRVRSDTGFCIGTNCITSWPTGGGGGGTGGPHVQSGRVCNILASPSVTVNFPTPFATLPVVAMTPSDTSDNNGASEYHGISQITTTGFTANFGGTRNNDCLDWIATDGSGGGGGNGIAWTQLFTTAEPTFTVPAGVNRLVIQVQAGVDCVLPTDTGLGVRLEFLANGTNNYTNLRTDGGNNNGAHARIVATASGNITVTPGQTVSLTVRKHVYDQNQVETDSGSWNENVICHTEGDPDPIMSAFVTQYFITGLSS